MLGDAAVLARCFRTMHEARTIEDTMLAENLLLAEYRTEFRAHVWRIRDSITPHQR